MGVCSPRPSSSRPGAARPSHHSAGRRGGHVSWGLQHLGPTAWEDGAGASGSRRDSGRSSDRCSSEVVASPSGRRQVLLRVLRTPLAPAPAVVPLVPHPCPQPCPFGAPLTCLLWVSSLPSSPCPCIIHLSPIGQSRSHFHLSGCGPAPAPAASRARLAAALQALHEYSVGSMASFNAQPPGSYTHDRCRRQQGI